MAFMTWNDKLSVGVVALDNDHKKMIVLLNELYDGIVAEQGKAVLGGILEQLKEYTRYHFRHEEELMERSGYLDAEIHKREHHELLVWSVKVNEQFNSGTLAAPSLEVMNYLKDWLFDHIMGSDQQYKAHLNAMGIH
jgi:hemerythrin-like metal-binding protein